MEDIDQQLTPWFSIWTKPRKTIQQIIESDPEKLVLLLAGIAGISRALDRASLKSMGDRLDWPIIVVIALIAGPIGGILMLYIAGALVKWTGSWIDGQGTPEKIRAALAWSSVPVVWVLPLWIPEIAIFGQELFTTQTPRIDASLSLALLLMAFGLLEVTVGIWTIVILAKCIGQVQGFSAWKGLGNLLLAGLVLFVPIFIVALLFVMVVT